MASTQIKASTAPFSPLQYQRPKLQKKFMLSLLHYHSQNKKNVQNNSPKALLLNIAWNKKPKFHELALSMAWSSLHLWNKKKNSRTGHPHTKHIWKRDCKVWQRPPYLKTFILGKKTTKFSELERLLLSDSWK